MPKTKHVAIFVLLLAGILLTAWISITRALLKSPIEQFESERTKYGWAHIGNLEATIGTTVTRRVLGELASHDTQLVFDGENRFAQVIDARNSTLNADGLAVYALGNHLVTKCEYGPAGSRIVNLKFDSNFLVIDYVIGESDIGLRTDDKDFTVRQNRIRWEQHESTDNCVPFTEWMR